MAQTGDTALQSNVRFCICLPYFERQKNIRMYKTLRLQQEKFVELTKWNIVIDTNQWCWHPYMNGVNVVHEWDTKLEVDLEII